MGSTDPAKGPQSTTPGRRRPRLRARTLLQTWSSPHAAHAPRPPRDSGPRRPSGRLICSPGGAYSRIKRQTASMACALGSMLCVIHAPLSRPRGLFASSHPVRRGSTPAVPVEEVRNRTSKRVCHPPRPPQPLRARAPSSYPRPRPPPDPRSRRGIGCHGGKSRPCESPVTNPPDAPMAAPGPAIGPPVRPGTQTRLSTPLSTPKTA